VLARKKHFKKVSRQSSAKKPNDKSLLTVSARKKHMEKACLQRQQRKIIWKKLPDGVRNEKPQLCISNEKEFVTR
jgi:hypothetical protein